MKIQQADSAIVLKPGRDRPGRRGHPWIFRGSIAHLPDSIADGDIAPVHTADGEWLAQGYVNRASQITLRLLSWQPGEAIDQCRPVGITHVADRGDARSAGQEAQIWPDSDGNVIDAAPARGDVRKIVRG